MSDKMMVRAYPVASAANPGKVDQLVALLPLWQDGCQLLLRRTIIDLQHGGKVPGFIDTKYRSLDGAFLWQYTIVRDDYRLAGGEPYVNGIGTKAEARLAAITALYGPRVWSTFEVPCPVCGAGKRECCTSPSGRTIRDHAARDEAADVLHVQGIDPRSAKRRG